MTVVAKRVLFYGRVQGVGFRWQTERAARGLAVGGHVRNLADGSVELVVEGDAAAVGDLLTRIHAALGPNIEREVETLTSPTGASGFQIRRDDRP